MRRFTLLFAAILLIASPARAQQPITSPGSPALVKWGKWGLLAASVAMNVMARQAHERADDSFAVITTACIEDRTRCATLPNGHYADPLLESKFQETVRRDSEARRWLIGGETALVGAAVGFIWELARTKQHPRNIPFEPEVSQRNGATQVGVRFAF